MYQKVSTDLNFVQREKEVEKFWKDNDIFKKSISPNPLDTPNHDQYNELISVKTQMETVFHWQTFQRTGEGASPVPVAVKENHSGVAL